MLSLTLEGLDVDPKPLWIVAGKIGRIRSGRLADYRVELFDSAGNEPLRGTLLTQPRWAESVQALCARGVHAALRGPQVSSGDGPGQAVRFRLSVHIRDELLCRIPAALSDATDLLMAGGRRFKLTERLTCRWQVACWMLSCEAFGGLEHPPIPANLDPPVYIADEVRYCRISDLPNEAATAYRQRYSGATMPAGYGVPYDAVFVWDMERVPGPGVGGVWGPYLSVGMEIPPRRQAANWRSKTERSHSRKSSERQRRSSPGIQRPTLVRPLRLQDRALNKLGAALPRMTG